VDWHLIDEWLAAISGWTLLIAVGITWLIVVTVDLIADLWEKWKEKRKAEIQLTEIAENLKEKISFHAEELFGEVATLKEDFEKVKNDEKLSDREKLIEVDKLMLKSHGIVRTCNVTMRFLSQIPITVVLEEATRFSGVLRSENILYQEMLRYRSDLEAKK
jgi:hypothetical protein